MTPQVIGGIQRYNAILQVNEVMERKITSRKCAVYGRGLPRPAALVLARQHNEFNLIQRVTSFAEIAACCRRLLFSHFGENEPDDGKTELKVPYHNTAKYRSFKKECLTFLLSTHTVNSLDEVKPVLIFDVSLSEFGTYRASDTNGSEVFYLPQDAVSVHIIRGRAT